MIRCRLPLILALGALLALVVAGCGTAQRGSEASPLAAVWNSAAPIGGTSEKSNDSKAGTPDKANASNRAAGGKLGTSGKPNFLSTLGAKIVDADGKEVKLTGINWFGLETGTYAPHGLWSRNYEEMLDQVAELGFNTIRLPYSNEALNPATKIGEGVDYHKNPDLEGLTPLQVMDKIVEGAGKRGIKVILDQHRPDAYAQSKLWYSDKVSEERWVSDWVMLAERYKGNDTVIGADLHNEPAGNATWGTGDPKTDWKMAAEKAGNAIHEVNTDWLIIVEGIENSSTKQNDGYWMGGNLTDAGKRPVRLNVPNKLVYSAHDYGPGVYNQNWFMDKSFPANMPAIWDSHWGYLVKEGIAPVLIGEFGGRSVGEDTEGTWQRGLMDYLKENGISYTYWSLNPNSGDTGGVLADDWTSVNEAKMSMLSEYQDRLMRVVKPAQMDTTVAPKAK